MNVTYDRSPINLVPTDEPLRKPNSIQLLSNQTASYENNYNEESKEKHDDNVYNFSNILDKIKIFNFMRSDSNPDVGSNKELKKIENDFDRKDCSSPNG